MTHYGRSPWLDRFPKSRIASHPRLHGHLDPAVVIVGGGLTGCATAYAFATAGIGVVVRPEADRIGRGTSASAAGWIADDPGTPFLSIEKAIGRRSAELRAGVAARGARCRRARAAARRQVRSRRERVGHHRGHA